MENSQLTFSDDVKDDVLSGSPDIIVLKFADSKIPLFKETRNKDYILYGEDNRYPEYLTALYNKSAKHNAILTGKANYIFGEGYENGDMTINRLGESLNDISKKCILDRAIYGGWRLEIIWNRNRRIAEIYHIDYNSIRTGKEGGFYFKERWEKNKDHDPGEFMDTFNPAFPMGSQVYAYDEYRPGLRFYPLPDYIGCNNYVETDIEISKFYLSSIRNGMMPSKMLQFYMGDPGEEKKRALEASFKKKFAGSENAGKFVMVFNPGGKDKAVDIEDLSGTDLDKMFIELNKTCQQEIFSGHLVTSPALFGIKTEGQLGNTQELKTAYEIFINTYAKPKANDFNKEINYLFSYSMWPGKYELRQTDPIGIQFDVKDVINSLPKAYVFEKMGIPQDQWNLPNIGSDNKPDSTGDITKPVAALPAPAPAKPAEPTAMANDNIKNLSAKQHQQLMRIIRQYGKGQLNDLQAKTLLRTGLGLSEDDINSILGITAAPVAPAAMSFEQQEEGVIAMFDECGDNRDDFEIVRSKKVSFSSELEAEADEEVFIQEAFKTYDVTTTEDRILEMIKKDSKITPEVIADAIGQTKSYVESKIDSLVKRGYLETTIETIGADDIIVRTVPKALDITIPPPTEKMPPVQISVKYSYEVKPGVGPAIISTSRPFCIKMIALNRLYSRAEIEQISERLGYSVFDRKGGWWGKNPECRHLWKSNIVVKKK